LNSIFFTGNHKDEVIVILFKINSDTPGELDKKRRFGVVLPEVENNSKSIYPF